jgi:hypothetical protein
MFRPQGRKAGVHTYIGGQVLAALDVESVVAGRETLEGEGSPGGDVGGVDHVAAGTGAEDEDERLGRSGGVKALQRYRPGDRDRRRRAAGLTRCQRPFYRAALTKLLTEPLKNAYKPVRFYLERRTAEKIIEIISASDGA